MGNKPNWGGALSGLGQFLYNYSMQQEQQKQRDAYLTKQGEMYGGLADKRAQAALDQIEAKKQAEMDLIGYNAQPVPITEGMVPEVNLPFGHNDIFGGAEQTLGPMAAQAAGIPSMVPRGQLGKARDKLYGMMVDPPAPEQEDPTFMFDAGGEQVPLDAEAFARETRLHESGKDPAGKPLYDYPLTDGTVVGLTGKEIADFDFKKSQAADKAAQPPPPPPPPETYTDADARALIAKLNPGGSFTGREMFSTRDNSTNRIGGSGLGQQGVKTYGDMQTKFNEKLLGWMTDVPVESVQDFDGLSYGVLNDAMDDDAQMEAFYNKIGTGAIDGATWYDPDKSGFGDEYILTADGKKKSIGKIADEFKKAHKNKMLFPSQIKQMAKDLGVDIDEFEKMLIAEGFNGAKTLLGMKIMQRPEKYKSGGDTLGDLKID